MTVLLLAGLAGGAVLTFAVLGAQGADLDWMLEELGLERWEGPFPKARDPDALVECSVTTREAFERIGMVVPEPTQEEIARAPEPLRWLFDGPSVELDTALRAAALSAAETWAHENCYLPCAAQMCGEVSTSYRFGHLKVYLRNEGLFQAIDNGLMFGPEALVLVRIVPLAVVDAHQIHTGCNRGC